MPTFVSGLRVARSYITPENTAVERAIDFQLGAQEGVALFGILGSIVPFVSAAASAFDNDNCVQTLHFETGSLETVPFGSGADEDTIDSEIVYRQDLGYVNQDEAATRGGSAAAMILAPSGMVTYPEPIFTARNVTHRGIGENTTFSYGCHVLIYYKFVRFSLSEMGVLLARRA